MNWPILLLLGGAVLAFYVFQLWARRQIITRWIDDALTDRQAGMLFVLSSIAPYAALLASVLALYPRAFLIMLAFALLVTAPTIVLNFALFDSRRGHKERLRRDREAKRLSPEPLEKARDR